MKQSELLRTMKVIPGSDIVRKYSFKTVRNSDALLARENHNLAMNIAISREKSVHFQEKDCFECISPHEIAA